MSVTTLAVLIAALILHSVFLIRRSSYLYRTLLVPFDHRIHLPITLNLVTEEEHNEVHKKLDRFMLRITLCIIAAAIGTICGPLAFVFAAYGMGMGGLGILTALVFAFVLSNYSLNSEMEKWTQSVENDLLAKLLVRRAEKSEHKTLHEYLHNENTKLMEEMTKAANDIVAEFEGYMIEEGYDPNKDYDASDDLFFEYEDILQRAVKRLEEAKPSQSKNPQ